MNASSYTELIAVLTIPFGLLAILTERMITKKGIGVRAVQFAAVATFAPLVLVLAIRGIIDGNAVAALVGAFVGYLFSNIADFDRRPSRDRGKEIE